MNLKQLISLLAALALLGGASYVLLQKNSDTWSAAPGRAGQKLLPNFQVNDASAIHIKGAANLEIVHRDDGWKVSQRGDYPANFTQVSDLLIKLSQLKIAQSDPIGPSQLGRMHLEQPGSGSNAAVLLEITASSPSGAASLLLGKKHVQQSAPGGGSGEEGYPDGRYVMLSSDPSTMLTISDPLNTADPNPTEWLNRDFFKIDKPNMFSFASTNASNSWTLARASDTGPWLLAGAGTNETLDINKVASMAGDLTYPSFVDVVPGADPATTGLDHPQTVTIKTFDHFTYTLKIGGRTPENNYYLQVAVAGDFPTARTPGGNEKPDDKKKLDAQFQDQLKQWQAKLQQERSLAPWVYVVDNWIIEPFTRPRADLLVSKSGGKPVAPDEDSTNGFRLDEAPAGAPAAQ